jgi:hypothetical protein
MYQGVFMTGGGIEKTSGHGMDLLVNKWYAKGGVE